MNPRTIESIIINLILATALIVSFVVVGYASYERGWAKGYHEAKCDQSIGRVSK